VIVNTRGILAMSASVVAFIFNDALVKLAAAGVNMVWIPTMFLPKDPRPLLDRFMREIAPHAP